jgi:hypothetical protein
MTEPPLPPRSKTLYNYAIFGTQGASTLGAILQTSSEPVATLTINPSLIAHDDDELYESSPPPASAFSNSMLQISINPSDSISQLIPTVEASILRDMSTLQSSLASQNKGLLVGKERSWV